MPGTSHLSVERRGPAGSVAWVTLSRPEVHNAFNAALIAELVGAFEAFAREPAAELRAVVISGAGTSFCAGADVDWMRASLTLGREENEADAARMAAMFAAIDTCPAPVVARVHGAALGGGVGLCAVSDLVVAEAETKFGLTETRLGLLPAVVSPFVIRKMGESHARALFTTGERFDAERALRIGLVHAVADGLERLDRAIQDVVSSLLAGGPNAVRAAKAVIREQRGHDAAAIQRMTVARIAAQRTSEEGQEGLSAFLERRSPGWKADDS